MKRDYGLKTFSQSRLSCASPLEMFGSLLWYLTSEQQVDWYLKGTIAVGQHVAEGTSASCTTMAECPYASCQILVEGVTEEEFSKMTLIDEYKECESEENNNPAFDSHFHLDRTSRKNVWSVKTKFRKFWIAPHSAIHICQ